LGTHDLKRTARIRVRVPPGTSQEYSFYYQYCEGGKLRATIAIRAVPRFHDDELGALVEKGDLPAEDAEELLLHSAQTRYLIAKSDNTSSNYLGVPDRLRVLLKRLL